VLRTCLNSANLECFHRIAFILAAVSFITVVLLPETLAYKILRKKATRLNKQSQNGVRFVSPGDVNRGSVWEALVCVRCEECLSASANITQTENHIIQTDAFGVY